MQVIDAAADIASRRDWNGDAGGSETDETDETDETGEGCAEEEGGEARAARRASLQSELLGRVVMSGGSSLLPNLHLRLQVAT